MRPVALKSNGVVSTDLGRGSVTCRFQQYGGGKDEDGSVYRMAQVSSLSQTAGARADTGACAAQHVRQPVRHHRSGD